MISRTSSTVRPLVLAVVVASAVMADAQTKRDSADSPKSAKPTSLQTAHTEESGSSKSASPELALLEPFIGTWRVTETHYDRRGEIVATVKGTEEVRWILERHALQRDYQTDTGSGLFHAIGTLTYNAAAKRYLGVWFDNVSDAGPTSVSGEWQKATRTMIFAVESRGKDGETVKFKIIEQFPDDERRIATTYLLEGSHVVKRMEVTYIRTIPCPAGVRGVFDDSMGRQGN